MERCKELFKNPKFQKIGGIVGVGVVLLVVIISIMVSIGTDGPGTITEHPPVPTVEISNDTGEPDELCDICVQNPCVCEPESQNLTNEELARFFEIIEGDPLVIIDNRRGPNGGGRTVEQKDIKINSDGTVTVTLEDGLTVTLTLPSAVTDASATSAPEGNQTGGNQTGGGTGATTTSGNQQPGFVGITLNGNTAVATQDGVDVRTNSSGEYIVRISAAGDYVITGTLNDGQIVVDADGVVNLILRNASITCSFGPAIRTTRINVNCPTHGIVSDDADSCANAVTINKLLTITNESGTTNTLIDSRAARPEVVEDPEDPESDTNDARNAAIFSRSNLTITGSGQLNISGGYLHGINSREALTISGARITVVKANGHGFRSRLSMTVSNGSNINITATGKGFRAAGGNFGSIAISGSTIKTATHGDAIHAQVNITVLDSTIDSIVDTGYTGIIPEEGSKRGIRAGGALRPNGVDIIIGNVNVSNSNVKINVPEDGVYSSGTVRVTGGSLNIHCRRRGIRAPEGLTLENTNVDIPVSERGVRAGNFVTITGGSVNIHARNGAMILDDGTTRPEPGSFEYTNCIGNCH